MPFYMSPEQLMREKTELARKGVARSRSSVVLQYAGGILMVTPTPSNVLHKISEIYDRIGFAAVGRYNEYEVLRKAGVTYADVTGYRYDRSDVTALGLANYYAQALGANASEPTGKPYEVEIVVAEVGATPDEDQIFRIFWDGIVSDEHGFVAFGGQSDQVATALKERFSEGMSLTEALGAALAALAAPSSGATSSNGSQQEQTNFEVAILDRTRPHRTFRRLTGPRLEELIAQARATPSDAEETTAGPKDGPGEPPTGPSAAGRDGTPK